MISSWKFARLPAFAVAGFLFGLCLLFYRGTFEVSDEQLMARTTQSIVEDFSLTFREPIYGLTSTGYGVGMPIFGIPFYLMEQLLRRAGLLGDSDPSLLPIVSALLFALMGCLVRLLVDHRRASAATLAAVAASPLLPASLTFYSDMLAAASLLSLAAAMTLLPRRDRAAAVIAMLACATAIAARSAMLPFVMLVLAWGALQGAARVRLFGGGLGIALGVFFTMLQNVALRGNPFSTGYDGQDFVTPLATGLHGLLLSPERGLLLFWPVAILPFAAWPVLSVKERRFGILAYATLFFSLVFHGAFWTWHGGWTTGPRFLLPAIGLLAVPVAATYARFAELPPRTRWLAIGGLLWSAVMAWIYARYSAYMWWKHAWEFHQIESLWQFAPQLSLWQAWLEGIPLPSARTASGSVAFVLITGLGLVCCGLSLPVLLREGALRKVTRAPFRHAIPIAAGLALFAWVILALLIGPRGWVRSLADRPVGAPLPILFVENEVGVYEGWIDWSLNGDLKIAFKADANYRITINEELLAEDTSGGGPHLGERKVQLTPGLHQIRVEVSAKPDGTAPFFRLYWTWPGGSRLWSPVGGEYLLARPLTGIEAVATHLWRKLFIPLAGMGALLMIVVGLRRRAAAAEDDQPFADSDGLDDETPP